MHLNIITLFPEMFTALEHGIVGRAIKQQIIQLSFWNPRDYTQHIHRNVDDRPYGGGPGMILSYQPLHDTLVAAKKSSQQPAKVVYLSPQGQVLTQQKIQHIANEKRLILLCGRYEGIDERLIQNDVDEEWSVGDYVVSGGELPAMLLIDTLTRLQPDALGDAQSAQQDSFHNGLLDHPHYTRPEKIGSLTVPKVLVSGDHTAIARWRLKQSLGNTWQKRPDLIKRRILSKEEQELLEEYKLESKK